MSGKILLIASFAILLWNCPVLAFATERALKKGAGTSVRKIFAGLASFYADKFHGRCTASGERFDQSKFTCAHKYLPFGTRLLVKNAHNGKVCIVTVNDRGPYSKNRVLDLSRAAALKLGITGIGQVICFTGGFDSNDTNQCNESEFRSVPAEIHGPRLLTLAPIQRAVTEQLD